MSNLWISGFPGYICKTEPDIRGSLKEVFMKKEDELYIKKLQEALELWQEELEKCKSYQYWYENYYHILKEKAK